jgi:hypothetical protein
MIFIHLIQSHKEYYLIMNSINTNQHKVEIHKYKVKINIKYKS